MSILLAFLLGSEMYFTSDSNLYMMSRVQAMATEISRTERQSLRDDHISMPPRFFSLVLGIGANGRGPSF